MPAPWHTRAKAIVALRVIHLVDQHRLLQHLAQILLLRRRRRLLPPQRTQAPPRVGRRLLLRRLLRRLLHGGGLRGGDGLRDGRLLLRLGREVDGLWQGREGVAGEGSVRYLP